MNRLITAAVAAFALGASVVPAQATQASAGSSSVAEPQARGRIIIDFVRYDPAGTDTGSNRHLNKEIVKITNNTNQRRTLTGWTLRDRGLDHTYRFPRTKVRPGRTVIVHTGTGRDHGHHRYWDQGWYVWNNDGDQATLRNRGGIVDRCAWGDGAGSTTC